MDIYILRDGAQTGPFSEETIGRLLEQKSVALTDLAWRPGTARWISLEEVLAQCSTTPPPPPPPTMPAAKNDAPAATAKPAENRSVGSEPATAKQKAFLGYMGISVPTEITKEQAALLVHDAMENPKDAARLTRWNDDRLRLHPDLFAAEIQAKKDNRANHFYGLAQSIGAKCFEGLSKAHAQVLVGYLDVKFPNWDAHESEATWNYFFPAIAEKFPDLVTKDWKGKLKYSTGPKVANELKERGTVRRPSRSAPSPVWALLKGVTIGAVVIVVVAASLVLLKEIGPQLSKTVGTQGNNPATSSAGAPTPPSPPVIETPGDGATPGTPPVQPAPATGAEPATSPDGSAPVAAVNPAMTPETTGSQPAAPGTAVVNPTPSSMDSLFGPSTAAPAAGTTGTAAAPVATPAAAPPTAPAQRRTNVVLTKAVEVPVPFGRAMLPAGTQLKLVAQEGAMVKVSYLNNVVPIPLSSTDLAVEGP